MTNKNFRVVPKLIPILQQHIKEVKWNCACKSIEMSIYETSSLDAFAWFGTINERHKESQKDSLIDFEKDSIKLTLFNDSNNEIANFNFKNLVLDWHECILDESVRPILHKIKITYKEFSLLPLKELDAEETIDEEWKSE